MANSLMGIVMSAWWPQGARELAMMGRRAEHLTSSAIHGRGLRQPVPQALESSRVSWTLGWSGAKTTEAFAARSVTQPPAATLRPCFLDVHGLV